MSGCFLAIEENGRSQVGEADRLEVGSEQPHQELSMAGPTKEYRAVIRVKLTEELLPSPVVSKEQLQQLLVEALNVGSGESPVVSVAVYDPR